MFSFRLPEFEGPLDLLLHLIEHRQLDIKRVSLAAVADQYLELISKPGAVALEALAVAQNRDHRDQGDDGRGQNRLAQESVDQDALPPFESPRIIRLKRFCLSLSISWAIFDPFSSGNWINRAN